MLKKSIFYVILSGLITSGAVLGWCKTTSEPVKQEDVAVQAEGKGIDPNIHQTVMTSLDSSDEMMPSLKAISNDERVKKLLKPSFEKRIRLVTPEVPPLVLEQKNEAKKPSTADVLVAMSENAGVKKAEAYAFADIAGGKLIESSQPEKTGDFAALLSKTKEESGHLLHTDGQKLKKLYWHCMDGTRNHCLVADVPMQFGVSESQMCDAAVSEFIFCGDKTADVFGANCSEENVADAAAIREALSSNHAEKGSFEIKGKSAEAPNRKFNFVKKTLQGCEIYSVNEEIAVVQSSTQNNEQETGFSLVSIAGATVAGVVMILLGLVCVRRKEEKLVANDDSEKALEDKENKEDKKDSLEDLRKECEQVKTERDAAENEKKELNKRISNLETEVKESEERNRQLNTQLEYARSQYKQEQIQRMNLAEDNRLLEEKLTESKANMPTVQNDKTQLNKGDIKKEETNRITAPIEAHKIVEDEQNVSSKDRISNRVTVQTEKKKIEQLTTGAPNSFFDSLTDEGWDELEGSFDALFATKKDTSLGNLIKDETNNTEESGEFSGFLEAVKENRKRDETTVGRRHVNTEMSLRSIDFDTKNFIADSPQTRRVLPTLRTVSPLKAATSNLETATLNGFKTINNAEAANATTKKTVEAEKPVSNETKNGKTGSTTKGMDENSLLNALKRRVKDVSELDNNAADKASTKTSGSFDYNRGLSKSGVFSVTGSRVDIDPFSDTEQFKAVYEDYITALKKIGEPTDKFTMEQFVSKLARQKSDLIKKNGYKNVTFSVVIKDGKPGINAVTQK